VERVVRHAAWITLALAAAALAFTFFIIFTPGGLT